jgi:low temperature requirement protein LtrA
MARDAYTRGHFLLILGALYLAAGVEEVIYHINRGGTEHADVALGWLAALGLLCAVVAAVTGFDHYARERA